MLWGPASYSSASSGCAHQFAGATAGGAISVRCVDICPSMISYTEQSISVLKILVQDLEVESISRSHDVTVPTTALLSSSNISPSGLRVKF